MKEEYYIDKDLINNESIDLLNRAVGILFKRFKERTEEDNNISIADKKLLLEKFESVVRCLRRKVLGIKDLYEKQEDNIEVLIELSETFDIEEKIEALLSEYHKIINEKIKIDKTQLIVYFTTTTSNSTMSKEYNL